VRAAPQRSKMQGCLLDGRVPVAERLGHSQSRTGALNLGPASPDAREDSERPRLVEGEPDRRVRAVRQRLILGETGEGHLAAALKPSQRLQCRDFSAAWSCSNRDQIIRTLSNILGHKRRVLFGLHRATVPDLQAASETTDCFGQPGDFPGSGMFISDVMRSPTPAKRQRLA